MSHRTVGAVLVLLTSMLAPVAAGAESPAAVGEGSTATPVAETPTAAAATPAGTGSATPIATPPPNETTQPPPFGSATVSSIFVEDVNENRVRDDDGVSRQTIVGLIPWSEPTAEASLELITGLDGSFAFKNLPPGDYSLRLYWPTGFVEPPASDELPDIIRAAFRINEDGSIGAPDPFPAAWPGLPLEPFDPARDRTILGSLPSEILLNKHDGSVLPPSSTGGPAAIGEIDVGAYLAGRSGVSPQLPASGVSAANEGSPFGWYRIAAFAVLLAAAAGFLLTRRRAG